MSKPTVLIGNSFCQLVVDGRMRAPESEVLREALTCWAKNYYFTKRYKLGQWDGKVRFYSLEQGMFPAGLLPIAHEAWEGQGLELEYVDRRKNRPEPLDPIPPYPLHEIELRDEQWHALNAILVNTLSLLPSGLWWPRGVVQMGTAGGKTVIVAALCAVLKNAPTLILVHTKDLLYQTQRVIKDAIQEPVGIVGDGRIEITHRVTVSTVQTVFKHLKELKPWLKTIQVFVSDECHHLKAKTFYKVAMNIPAFCRIAVSATPFSHGKDPEHDMRLVASSGGLLYILDAANLIELGRVAPVTVRFWPIDSPKSVVFPGTQQTAPAWKLPYNPRHGYPGAYQTLIIENAARNRKIVDYARSVVGPTLIIVTRLEHGRLLSTMLDCTFLSGLEDSTVRQRELANLASGKTHTLVATTIFDEGIDAPECRFLIIACGGRSRTKMLQRIGRGMRLKKEGGELEVLDFLDGTNRHLHKHSAERVRTCQVAGFQVELLES